MKPTTEELYFSHGKQKLWVLDRLAGLKLLHRIFTLVCIYRSTIHHQHFILRGHIDWPCPFCLVEYRRHQRGGIENAYDKMKLSTRRHNLGPIIMTNSGSALKTSHSQEKDEKKWIAKSPLSEPGSFKVAIVWTMNPTSKNQSSKTRVTLSSCHRRKSNLPEARIHRQ